jgi:Nucleotidyl transferase AbiEii toxin, Type IV TA system
MAKGPGRDVGASVRDRLTNQARSRGESVQLLLTRYAIERLLYRLGRSALRDRFALKGAMLLSLWATVPYRATGDLDLLGFGESAPERIADTFREICATPVEDDGVRFLGETLKAEAARAGDEYGGVRLSLHAVIAGARLPVRVDVGFGDAVTPGLAEIAYPSLLDLPRPRLRAYPPETVVAEKLQALVAFGLLNSRMKDFFDLWAISGLLAFDGAVLGEAIRATFERRATPVPADPPVALTAAFADDPGKRAQWRAFLRRTATTLEPPALPDLIKAVAGFVLPPMRAVAGGATFELAWRAGGPWR